MSFVDRTPNVLTQISQSTFYLISHIAPTIPRAVPAKPLATTQTAEYPIAPLASTPSIVKVRKKVLIPLTSIKVTVLWIVTLVSVL